MGKREDGGAKLGALEMRVLIEPRDGSEPTDTTTTPSMWAAADQWLDGLLWEEPHTRAWIDQKLVQGIYLQAAQSEDLMRAGDLSLERIAEFVNLYEVTPLDDDGNPIEPEAEGGGDPNGETPAGEA